MLQFRRPAALIATVAALGMLSVSQATTLRAQDMQTQQGQQQRMRDPLEGLNLTPAQRTQIDSIRAKYKTTNDAQKAEMQAMYNARQNHDTAAMKAAHDQWMANRDTWRTANQAQHKEIMAVLTPEQRKQVEDRMKQWKKEHKGMGMDSMGGNAPQSQYQQ